MPEVVIVSATGDSFDVVAADHPDALRWHDAVLFAAGRNPAWRPAAREFVRRHPFCAVCRGKSDLQVHHEFPVHLFPDHEMDERFWHVLCRRDHLVFGHLGDFVAWNPSVREDILTWAARFDQRPY